ncbi:MAG TPA: hypothetical protein H9768_00390 [Candidatus Mailhella merdavium]|nr:hypothetical protein [Candidatus Mailhella merdavium]
MADPKWFEEDYYLEQKLAQLQATDKSWANKDVDDVKSAFAAAGLTAYEHFVAYGNAEWVSPNSAFDVNYYLASKAVQCNNIAADGKTDWTVKDVVDAFEAAGLSAWEHYTLYGAAEGVDPSADFSTDQYFQDKLVQLNKEDGGGWTLDSVKAAFAESGLNPLAHSVEYGEAEGLAPKASEQSSDVALIKNGGALIPGTTPELSLDEAVALAVEGTLPDVYTLADPATGGEYTVDEAGHVASIVEGAKNGDSLNPSYTIADTLANLMGASASVANGATDKIIVDTYETVKAANFIDWSNFDSARLTGDDSNGALSFSGIGSLTINELAGGNGADYLYTNTADKILFGGSITEKDEKTGLYAESQDRVTSTALNADFDKDFVNSNPGDGQIKWLSDEAINLLKGANIFDIHGEATGTTAVASTVKDVFLLQSGGKTTGSNGKDDEHGPETLTIHNFKVGQDALMIINQGTPTSAAAESSIDADILTLLTKENGITLNYNNTQKATITIDWSTLEEHWDGLDTTGTTTITLQGVQGLENVENVADFFQVN